MNLGVGWVEERNQERQLRASVSPIITNYELRINSLLFGLLDKLFLETESYLFADRRG